MYFELTVVQFSKMLKNLSTWLNKAEQYAETKKFDTQVFCKSRLAPDQFDFTRQIQIACDTAKFCVARLTGREVPAHPDTETNFAELRTRIESTLAILRDVKPGDYVDAGKRVVTQPRWEGKTMSGENFAIQHAIPNFYFHTSMAYAILRHNGVDLGKKDYLGEMPYSK